MTQMQSADATGTVVAIFGAGQLVQLSNGRLAMRGGTLADHREAKEWVSLFMSERILSPVEKRTGVRATACST